MFDNLRTKSVFLILAAALFINAAMLFVALPILGEFLSSRYNLGFMDLYDQIANNLAQGNGYRVEADMGETMIREPGYPLFLTIVFKIGGSISGGSISQPVGCAWHCFNDDSIDAKGNGRWSDRCDRDVDP